ncbi:hypothetical protein ILP92_15455 [Maribius pontilimi]|uniref:ISXO2-like transposase domain-containing protein n=1 Tax=Palleronia pontilimi TaxID=1964209 RepID=A0A934ME43_9RHOB|nr:hypothetical protein [Palleronia pontilimi]MBJ3764145.1 hypothetical protein [Palleronia pontilimi]
MKPLLSKDAVLCSDGASGYATVAANGGIEYFLLGSKPGARVTGGCYHILKVNSLHARYDKCVKPFCGPATKNLHGYTRWLEARLAGMKPAEVIRAA